MSLSNPWQDLMQSTWYICNCGSRYPNNGFWAATRPLSILNSVCGELAQIVLGVGFVRSLPRLVSDLARCIHRARWFQQNRTTLKIAKNKNKNVPYLQINMFSTFYNNCILFNNNCRKLCPCCTPNSRRHSILITNQSWHL